MSNAVLEWLAGTERRPSQGKGGGGYSIAPAVVKDNLNVLSEGRVQVHIPSLPSFDPWARVVGLGAASSRGFVWIPQTGDEVLVAFNENDERDAYIIGGLWSMVNRPPLTAPTDFLTKRVIQTGLGSAPGHIVEFDDALQSVSITTSTSQKIVMDPTTVAISAFKDTAKLTIAVGPPPSITIESTSGDISLKAPLGTISLEAADVDISGTKSASFSTEGSCTIEGLTVDIN
jgi:phage baseplate assembly protein gpV